LATERGVLATEEGRFEEARTHFDQALEILAIGGREFDEKRMRVHNLLGNLHLDIRNYDRAAEHFEQAIALGRRCTPDQPAGIAIDELNLSLALTRAGELERARDTARSACPVLLSSDRVRTAATCLMNLAVIENQLGAPQRALDRAREALAVAEDVYRPDDIDLWAIRAQFGEILYMAGHAEEGVAQLQSAVTALETIRGDKDPYLHMTTLVLAKAQLAAGDEANARTTLERLMARDHAAVNEVVREDARKLLETLEDPS
jgi:tetratricopeptide (TPR) repeat protein